MELELLTFFLQILCPWSSFSNKECYSYPAILVMDWFIIMEEVLQFYYGCFLITGYELRKL